MLMARVFVDGEKKVKRTVSGAILLSELWHEIALLTIA